MSFLNHFVGKKQTFEPAAKKSAVKPVVKKEKKETASDAKEAPVKEITQVEQPIIAAAALVKKANRAYAVLLHPIVTEKTTFLQSEDKYGFVVSQNANKSEVRHTVEAQYNVHVVSVNIMNRAGKKVHFGRMNGTRRQMKKAIVTVKSGEHIEIHQHV